MKLIIRLEISISEINTKSVKPQIIYTYIHTEIKKEQRKKIIKIIICFLFCKKRVINSS